MVRNCQKASNESEKPSVPVSLQDKYVGLDRLGLGSAPSASTVFRNPGRPLIMTAFEHTS